MPDKPIPILTAPRDWGTDSLAKFMEDAQYNMVATFSNLRQQYDALVEVDGLYCKMIENLNQHPEFLSGFLLFRTHSSFRGAVRLSLSGQLAEAYMVLRACLESALYGLYVTGDTNRQEIWLRRHEDDASRRQVKSEFTIASVFRHLETIDAKTHHIAKELYEHTIDYGGHPNERAVSTQIKTESSGSRIDVTAESFLCGDESHQLSLRSAAQIGICCLDIFSNMYRDRYHILGIDHRLNQIRKAL